MNISKKNKYLGIAICSLIVAIAAFYMGLLAVRRPSPLGENPPSREFFSVIFTIGFIAAGTCFGKFWSLRNKA